MNTAWHKRHRMPRRASPAQREFRLHLTLAIALPLCLAAGAFELTRAMSGHEIGWIYAVEWPLIGAYGVYLWWRLLKETRAEARDLAVGDVPADDAGTAAAADQAAENDPELAAWQAYLARLHETDPPGGPPGYA